MKKLTTLCTVVLALFTVSSASASTVCPVGTTMTVAAHQDDTILFMSPDIIKDVRAGRCLRSLFISSGAHTNTDYMLQREHGIEAAYAQMAGVPNEWTYTTVRSAGHYVTEARLNSRVTLDFFRLNTNDAWPIGSNGNPANGDPSLLSALERKWTPSLTTIDGPTTYTRQGLVDTILAFMKRYQPNRVDTQDFTGHYGWGDHADHRAVGYMTRAAWRQYHHGTLVSYLGYISGSWQPNVSGAMLEAKIAAFNAYQPFDGCVPQTADAIENSVYAGWMPAQYRLATIR